jgi:iron complex transport system permease protein
MTSRRLVFLLLLSLTVLLGLVISLGVGAVRLTPKEVFAALTGTPIKTFHSTIVWDFRLARGLLVCLCGAALSAAGVGFQGLFRNPLADPYIVGASSGAALGATLSVVLTHSSEMSLPINIAAFIGSLSAVFLVYLLTESSGFGSIAALLLAGAALSTMLSAIVSLLLILNDQALREVFAWLLGGFGGRSWNHLEQTVWVALIGIAALWLMSRPLDALAGGEDSAHALGLNLHWARFVIVGGASLATAAAVSAAGIIGFIGLISPHIARSLFGAGHAYLFPASMLIGMLLLLFADCLARGILPPLELPVGVLTALLGAPFFLFMLRWRGRTV